MNIDEDIMLKMLNPKYKDLFELVAKRGFDELKETDPDLIEQIRKELVLSGHRTLKIGSETLTINNQLDRLADIHEAEVDDMFGSDGF